MAVVRRQTWETIKRRLRPWLGKPARRAWAWLRGGQAGLALFDRREAGWPKSQAEFEQFWQDSAAQQDYVSPSRARLFADVLDALPGPARRWLDIGCGGGHLLSLVAHRWPEADLLVGVDYARSALQSARRQAPRAAFVRADAETACFRAETFDQILITETLEHLARPEQALAAAWRMLAPGGYVCVSVPDGAVDNWVGHTNFWRLESFRDFLSPYPVVRLERNRDGDSLLALLRKP